MINTKNMEILEEEKRAQIREELHDKEQKEIYKIKEVARIYKELQVLMPKFKNDYLDAYLEIAESFYECMFGKSKS